MFGYIKMNMLNIFSKHGCELLYLVKFFASPTWNRYMKVKNLECDVKYWWYI